MKLVLDFFFKPKTSKEKSMFFMTINTNILNKNKLLSATYKNDDEL